MNNNTLNPSARQIKLNLMENSTRPLSGEEANFIFKELTMANKMFWTMILVFFSTVLMIGRSMFEVGVLKPKSTRHVAAKNLCQLSLCTIV